MAYSTVRIGLAAHGHPAVVRHQGITTVKQATTILVTAAFACGLVAAPVARATKPCRPSPCEDAAGQFHRVKCETSADWIAQGTITDVVHHREGPPTGKDFAEFTFTTRHWEKKPGGLDPEFRFTVGWCENRQPLPASTTGSFRIFGLASKAGASTAPRYLYIERVGSGSK